MMRYHRIAAKPQLFRCFTGLTLAAFHQLLVAFQEAYEALLDEQDARREIPRQRQRGGGRHAVLYTAADKLVLSCSTSSSIPPKLCKGSSSVSVSRKRMSGSIA